MFGVLTSEGILEEYEDPIVLNPGMMGMMGSGLELSVFRFGSYA